MPKIANWALSLLGFFYVLVLMLLNKFIPNRTFKKCSSVINLFNYERKFAPNVKHLLHHCRKLVQSRSHRGTGTKKHKCLVIYQTSSFGLLNRLTLTWPNHLILMNLEHFNKRDFIIEKQLARHFV